LLDAIDTHTYIHTHIHIHTHALQGNLVRRVDAVVRGVYWSEGGTQVAVVSDDSFYLLQFNAEVVEAALAGAHVYFCLFVCLFVRQKHTGRLPHPAQCEHG